MSRRRHHPNNRPRRLTSHDVAAEAGVSQATVARVFSSPDRVAPGTRARVEAAATRLGYVPNAIARSLKSQRTHIIGAVVPASGEYWQSVLTSFSRQLADHGRQLLLFSFADAEHVDDALAAVEQYRVDGLILASATIGPERLVRMQRPGLPIVVFNHPAAQGTLPSVSVDNEAGSGALADHLAELDIDNVLFVGGVASASTDQSRYRGAARALGAHGVPCSYLEAGAYTYEAGYRIAAEITGDAAPTGNESVPTDSAPTDSAPTERAAVGGALPGAVMVGSDEVAFGVIDGLRTAGVDVPGDVVVTGFDGLPQAAWAGYDLTTLVQPVDLLVAEAIDIVLDEDPTEADGDGPKAVVVPGTVRIGMTTTGSAAGSGRPGSASSTGP